MSGVVWAGGRQDGAGGGPGQERTHELAGCSPPLHQPEARLPGRVFGSQCHVLETGQVSTGTAKTLLCDGGYVEGRQGPEERREERVCSRRGTPGLTRRPRWPRRATLPTAATSVKDGSKRVVCYRPAIREYPSHLGVRSFSAGISGTVASGRREPHALFRV
ncbi:hypothetical protein E2C01_067651 [Portunus trituberculatus]|uniref:Uncharacterized protein n=1 Tax=Portunus trituberculatus TaxID=210409 RepID=A0A5B7HUC2_PORTR|nr:hypothetical protein [Portunus trituberculatus]